MKAKAQDSVCQALPSMVIKQDPRPGHCDRPRERLQDIPGHGFDPPASPDASNEGRADQNGRRQGGANKAKVCHRPLYGARSRVGKADRTVILPQVRPAPHADSDRKVDTTLSSAKSKSTLTTAQSEPVFTTQLQTSLKRFETTVRIALGDESMEMDYLVEFCRSSLDQLIAATKLTLFINDKQT